MVWKLFVVSVFFIFILLIPGCVKQETQVQKTEKEIALEKCLEVCKEEKQSGSDLSNGPCLGNPIVEGWVCDIAHSPRQDIDNKPENQCSFFREGKAKHFVELDMDCKVIKVY